MRNFKDFLNEGKIYRSGLCQCGGSHLVLVFETSNFSLIIDENGNIDPVSNRSSFIFNNVKISFDTIKKLMLEKNYDVYFFCKKCEEESYESLTIEYKKYFDAEEALLKIISLLDSQEIIKDEDIEWF
jgi:hypothetical protein